MIIWRSIPCVILSLLFLAGCRGKGGSSAETLVTTPSFTPSPTLGEISLLPTETALPTPTLIRAPSNAVIIAAVGDIMLARSVGVQIAENGPGTIFTGVLPELKSVDLRIGNLECAITQIGIPEKKSYGLRAPPQAAQALELAGFDIVSLANNHSMDFGYQGLMDMQKTLKENRIATVGAGSDSTTAHQPVIIEKNGLRIAFLAYLDVLPENSGFDPKKWIATETKPGIAWADPEKIKKDVMSARQIADQVVVFLHSGYEITDVINNLSENQRNYAHVAIDAGASVVIGSHPHVLQEIERYHGGLIAYSLGNFVFDQYKGIADASIILRFTLTRQGVQTYDWVPVIIENGLPHVIAADQVPAIGTLVAPDVSNER